MAKQKEPNQVEAQKSAGKLLWAARCNICGEIECCPNGTFAEVAAKNHAASNPDHEVILGNIYSTLTRD